MAATAPIRTSCGPRCQLGAHTDMRSHECTCTRVEAPFTTPRTVPISAGRSGCSRGAGRVAQLARVCSSVIRADLVCHACVAMSDVQVRRALDGNMCVKVKY